MIYHYECRKCGRFICGGSTGKFGKDGKRIIQDDDNEIEIITTQICSDCIVDYRKKIKESHKEIDPYGEENWEV